MPDTLPNATSDSRAKELVPRIVFFGPPFSGKSELLRSFLRLAVGPDSDVEPVPDQTGEPTIRRELVPHRILVENPNLDPGGVYELIDCDGQAARELLDHANPFVRGAARGALAKTVQTADAVVIVVDATSSPAAEERTFADFKRFLENLEEGRSFGREVGGFPIFLTLTKCDRLASADDEPSDWLGRIEVRKQALKAHFESIFGEDDDTGDDPSPFLPFGSLDHNYATTGTKVPPGPAFQVYADDDGTFGIVDLVATVLPAAKAYRGRVRSAHRRLRWILTGSAIVLGTMLVAGMILIAAGGFGGSDALTARVLAYESSEGPPAVRLADKNFARNQKELTAIRSASGFDRLPERIKSLVEDRLVEFDAYKDYRNKFRPPRLGPGEVQTHEQLERLEAELDAALKPPEKYARAWSDTETVQLYAKWQKDSGLVREVVEQLNAWYTNPTSTNMGLIPQGNRLLLTKTAPDAAWRAAVTKLLDDAGKPPFKPTDPVANSPETPGLRGKKLTYAVAYGFDRNVRAHREWDDLARQLGYLRDLTDAIGLTSSPGVLDVPEGNVSPELAKLTLAKLRQMYPPAKYPNAEYPEWAVGGLPDSLRTHLETRLRGIRTTGEHQVRKFLRTLPGPAGDTEAGWRSMREAIQRDDRTAAWGTLLHLLARVVDPAAADPVQLLVAYLAQDKFDLDVRAITVTIPDDLTDPPISGVEALVITHSPHNGSSQEYKFTPKEKPQRERPLTTYTFVPQGHSGSIVYRPGDKLTATLPVRSGAQEFKLVWSAGRSTWYQLDNLGQPPRLEKPGSPPNPAHGIRLTTPNSSLSAPSLLPNLR